ncbi:hypothetical protein [Flavobacterium sp. ACN6]|uniref:hypothetical protein n=1 Tax=Flavobacterium sp. ACN6 TaxID=1920426 RepID=UPI001143E5CA|nr:hypothetical protein [Flavobacterium sp. ACN6]
MRLALFLFAITTMVFSQEKKCVDFKTGVFSYINPVYKRYKVVRKENVQIETDTVTGIVLEGAIEWKSDCEYVLTYVKVPDNAKNGILGQKINVQINNITGNKILCRSEGLGFKKDIEMIKIDN